MNTDILVFGHEKYEKAYKFVENAKSYIKAVDRTSIKEYLEVHGIDPLYRNWIRLTFRKMESVELFCRIYLYKKPSAYFKFVLSDYFFWHSMNKIISLEDIRNDLEIINNNIKPNQKLYVCKEEHIKKFFEKSKKFEEIIDDFFEEYGKEEEKKIIHDCSTLLEGIEKYKKFQIDYYNELIDSLKGKYIESEILQIEKEKLRISAYDTKKYFLNEFLYKEFLLTENMIFDYINPRAKLGQHIVMSILIDDTIEQSKKFKEMFLFTYFLLKSLAFLISEPKQIISIIESVDKAFGKFEKEIEKKLGLT